jgi:hypothetical protein
MWANKLFADRISSFTALVWVSCLAGELFVAMALVDSRMGLAGLVTRFDPFYLFPGRADDHANPGPHQRYLLTGKESQ